VAGVSCHPHGVSAVDALYVRPGLDAIHVVVHGGRAALIDSGTTHSVPQVLAALQQLGVARRPCCIRAVRRTWSIRPH